MPMKVKLPSALAACVAHGRAPRASEAIWEVLVPTAVQPSAFAIRIPSEPPPVSMEVLARGTRAPPSSQIAIPARMPAFGPIVGPARPCSTPISFSWSA